MSRVVAWGGPSTPFVPPGSIKLFRVGEDRALGNLFLPDPEEPVRRRVVFDASSGRFVEAAP